MNNEGRPLKWTAENLKEAVDTYIATTAKPTLAGLAFYLEINRQTLYNYAERDEFLDIIKKARSWVEMKYEERLIYENNSTGVIFALKNMGWADKSESEVTHKGVTVNLIPAPGCEPLKDEGEQ